MASIDVFVPRQYVDREAQNWPASDITWPQPSADAVSLRWAVKVLSATGVHLEASWTTEPSPSTLDGSELVPAVVVDISDIDLAAGTFTTNSGSATLGGDVLTGTYVMAPPTVPVDPAIVRLQLTWSGPVDADPLGAELDASMPTTFQGGN